MFHDATVSKHNRNNTTEIEEEGQVTTSTDPPNHFVFLFKKKRHLSTHIRLQTFFITHHKEEQFMASLAHLTTMAIRSLFGPHDNRCPTAFAAPPLCQRREGTRCTLKQRFFFWKAVMSTCTDHLAV